MGEMGDGGGEMGEGWQDREEGERGKWGERHEGAGLPRAGHAFRHNPPPPLPNPFHVSLSPPSCAPHRHPPPPDRSALPCTHVCAPPR